MKQNQSKQKLRSSGFKENIPLTDSQRKTKLKFPKLKKEELISVKNKILEHRKKQNLKMAFIISLLMAILIISTILIFNVK